MTHFEVAAVIAESCDFDTEFMSENAGIFQEGECAFEGVDVGAAKANVLYVYKDFTGTRLKRGRCLDEFEVFGALENNGIH